MLKHPTDGERGHQPLWPSVLLQGLPAYPACAAAQQQESLIDFVLRAMQVLLSRASHTCQLPARYCRSHFHLRDRQRVAMSSSATEPFVPQKPTLIDIPVRLASVNGALLTHASLSTCTSNLKAVL